MNINMNPGGKMPTPAVPPTAERTAAPAGPKPTSEAAPAPVPAQSAATAPSPTGSDDVRKAAKQVNEALKGTASSDLQFSVEGNNKDVVVRVVDSQTKELIRQIPSEEMVAMSKALDNLSGLLIQQKA